MNTQTAPHGLSEYALTDDETFARPTDSLRNYIQCNLYTDITDGVTWTRKVDPPSANRA
jgi:hypothetical protein